MILLSAPLDELRRARWLHDVPHGAERARVDDEELARPPAVTKLGRCRVGALTSSNSHPLRRAGRANQTTSRSLSLASSLRHDSRPRSNALGGGPSASSSRTSMGPS